MFSWSCPTLPIPYPDPVTATLPEIELRHGQGVPEGLPAWLTAWGAMLAGTLVFAGYIALEVYGIEVSNSGEPFPSTALMLAPWLLTLPWLKHLDIRPVPWFYFCAAVGFFAAPILVAKVVFRALSLPRRGWPVEYWNAHRARRIPDTLRWVLLPVEAVAPRREPMSDRVLRYAWTGLVVVTLPLWSMRDSEFPDWVGITILGAHLVVCLATVGVSWQSRRWSRVDRQATV